jgi:O-antigen/teichoic acid export membrane protein
MIAYSASTVLYAAGAVVLYQTMKFLAALRCGGPEAAGHMGLSISLAQTVSVVFTPLVAVLHARVGQLHGEGRLSEVPRLLERAFLALGLILVPSVVFLVVDAPVIFRAWLGGSLGEEAIAELAAATRLLFIGHGFYIAVLPFYYALLGVGQHRIFGLGMLVVGLVNVPLGWFAAGVLPRIETLAAVYGGLMLGLALFVTGPAGLRRFPLPLRQTLVRAFLVPLAAALPGAAALALRPRGDRPLFELAIDASLFAALTLPGLELARRRYGLLLTSDLRG